MKHPLFPFFRIPLKDGTTCPVCQLPMVCPICYLCHYCGDVDLPCALVKSQVTLLHQAVNPESALLRADDTMAFVPAGMTAPEFDQDEQADWPSLFPSPTPSRPDPHSEEEDLPIVAAPLDFSRDLKEQCAHPLPDRVGRGGWIVIRGFQQGDDNQPQPALFPVHPSTPPPSTAAQKEVAQW